MNPSVCFPIEYLYKLQIEVKRGLLSKLKFQRLYVRCRLKLQKLQFSNGVKTVSVPIYFSVNLSAY